MCLISLKGQLKADECRLVKRHPKGEASHNCLVKIVDENDDYLVTVNERISRISNTCGVTFNCVMMMCGSSPKCGTTWAQETTWHIMNGVQLERTQEHLFKRSPFLDLAIIKGSSLEESEELFKNMDELPSPRTIKTHFPLELLPPKLLKTCKVMFVNRNVKYACFSSFHHISLMKHFGFFSNFEEFAEVR